MLAAAAVTSHAGAMNSNNSCVVVAGDKLPEASGGAQKLCEAVERAVNAAAPGAVYRAQITVVSRSRLSATLVVHGRTLPEQKFAVMDRDLNAGAIDRFAKSLAETVAKAAKS